jgi:anti-sigma B factor antagonist
MRPIDDSNVGSPDLTGKPAEIQTHLDSDSVTITVSGEVDVSAADKLDAAIRAAFETEIGQIVVDLSDLSFLDSVGLSVLLQASVRSRQNGNPLSFIPSKHEAVTRLLALTETAEKFDSPKRE